MKMTCEVDFQLFVTHLKKQHVNKLMKLTPVIHLE
jgi:hypothetical protein